MPLTCVACSLVFDCLDEQKIHYRLDWHRVNLKRKAAGLPSISNEDYERRKAAALEMQNQNSKAAIPGECLACRKEFSSQHILQDHLRSKKHIQKQRIWEKNNNRNEDPAISSSFPTETQEAMLTASELPPPPPTPNEPKENQPMMHEANPLSEHRRIQHSKIEDFSEMELQQETKAAPLLVDSCLFCAYGSRNNPEESGVEQCLNHMLKSHGFFIPDAEYLVDIEGLLMYLQEKVKRGIVCLYCHKQSTGLQAVQSHMKSKGHCKILYDPDVDMAEYSFCYDFSGSYADVPRGIVTDDADRMDESCSEGSEDDLDPPVKFKKMFETNEIGELVLLDGRVVGNRQYQRYYRQHLRPTDDRESIVAQAKENHQKLLQQFGLPLEENLQIDLRTPSCSILNKVTPSHLSGKERILKDRKRFDFTQNKKMDETWNEQQ